MSACSCTPRTCRISSRRCRHRALTPRETQVLRQAVDGRPSKQIAHQLNISLLTVNAHLTSIYRKCEVSSREELFAQLQ